MSRWIQALAPVAVGLFAGVLQLPTFDRTMNLMDEGHILQYADIVYRGGELYRDATLLPLPGAFYLLAAAFDVFGPSVRIARWLVVVEFALLSGLVFVLMRRLLSTRWALCAVGTLLIYKTWAFPHWLMYSYSTTSLTLLALALVAFVRFLDGGSRAALAGAGLAVGLGILCKQDYGMAVLLALNAVLWIAVRSGATAPARPVHLFGWLDAPVLALGALTALHFLRQGLFLEMLQQTALNHFVGMATFEYTSLPPILPFFEPQELFRTPVGIGVYGPGILFMVDWDLVRHSHLYQNTIAWDLAVKLFFYLPYIIVAAGALRLWRTRDRLRGPERRPGYLRELTLYAFATSLVLVLNKPVDYVHVCVLYWPLLLLMLVWGHALLRARPRLAVPLLTLALLVALPLAAYTARLAWMLRAQNDTPLASQRAGIYAEANNVPVVDAVVDYVRANSGRGDRVAVLPYFSLISFLAERDAPHRAIYTFWPVEYIPGRQRQIIEAIEASETDLLIYHFTQFLQFPRMDEFAPELFDWIVDHYEMDEVFTDERWGLMMSAARRRSHPPVGRPLLDADAGTAELFVEDGSGERRPIAEVERGEYLRFDVWPFRRVFALRPLSGGRKTVLSIPVDVPAGARLVTAVGVKPTRWFRYPPRAVRFGIRARTQEGLDILHVEQVDPHRHAEQRRWFEIEVSLDAYAGRHIRLEFASAVESEEGEEFEMAGWEVPRLVTGAEVGSALVAPTRDATQPR